MWNDWLWMYSKERAPVVQEEINAKRKKTGGEGNEDVMVLPIHPKLVVRLKTATIFQRSGILINFRGTFYHSKYCMQSGFARFAKTSFVLFADCIYLHKIKKYYPRKSAYAFYLT